MSDRTIITDAVCEALTLCERGNTLLRGIECDKMMFVATVVPGLHFFVEDIEGNYPSVNTWFAEYTDEGLADFVRKHYGGWLCVKNNHDLPVDDEGCVLGVVDDREPGTDDPPLADEQCPCDECDATTYCRSYEDERVMCDDCAVKLGLREPGQL